ncbi:uncharacterized protein LOC127005964 [Eriocheir sinensis]|uniref:uncharacterized protein LOC127005964 n=1 Tax=Eriocheir sinensis TaxID=95602 RepID=UPI0021CA5660|nr:uncharacterized protein LOC127005964 [Eriocheir sinensis]XP_050731394.1 uncharacterized protein LOC127005964 [Eriocheir sinensis]XP_050731395.1 uncharacterized protein LOC127005964 [Eriocheir sinensis]
MSYACVVSLSFLTLTIHPKLTSLLASRFLVSVQRIAFFVCLFVCFALELPPFPSVYQSIILSNFSSLVFFSSPFQCASVLTRPSVCSSSFCLSVSLSSSTRCSVYVAVCIKPFSLSVSVSTSVKITFYFLSFSVPLFYFTDDIAIISTSFSVYRSFSLSVCLSVCLSLSVLVSPTYHFLSVCSILLMTLLSYLRHSLSINLLVCVCLSVYLSLSVLVSPTYHFLSLCSIVLMTLLSYLRHSLSINLLVCVCLSVYLSLSVLVSPTYHFLSLCFILLSTLLSYLSHSLSFSVFTVVNMFQLLIIFRPFVPLLSHLRHSLSFSVFTVVNISFNCLSFSIPLFVLLLTLLSHLRHSLYINHPVCLRLPLSIFVSSAHRYPSLCFILLSTLPSYSRPAAEMMVLLLFSFSTFLYFVFLSFLLPPSLSLSLSCGGGGGGDVEAYKTRVLSVS